MTTKIKHKSIYLDVSTFDNLRTKGESVINLLEYILHKFILPFNDSLQITIKKMNGRKKTCTFNDKNWISIKKEIKTGNILQVFVTIQIKDEIVEAQFLTNAMAVSVTFDHKFEIATMGLDKNCCNNIAFSISERVIQHPLPLDIQNNWVKLFIRVFTEMNGVNGFINLGYPTASIMPFTTMLEGLYGLYFGLHSEKFDKMARGYFWGNILSEGHMERLGGIESFIKNVPCHRVEELNFGDRRAVYFQLTPDINDYSNDQLRVLKNFLRPILPEEDMEKVLKRDPTGSIRKNARLIFD